MDEHVARLGNLDRQREAIFTVHGRPAGVELLDRAGTW